MILLTARWIDVQGQCQFRIESDGGARVTRDAVKAAKILSNMGVGSPTALVDHAREWGSVEILDGSGEGHPQPALRPGPI